MYRTICRWILTMKRNRPYSKLYRALITVFVLCMGFVAKSQDNSLSVIANVSGAPSEMKFSELKAIMMGEKQRWKNGKKITIALIKTNKPIGKTTCDKIYKMSGDEVNKFWLSQVFQGRAQAPQFFSTAEELQAYVAQNEGTIGILTTPTASSEIKTVTIDGKKSF